MQKISRLKAAFVCFGKDDSGAVATEYAFLIAFIAIVAALGMVLLGENLSAFFNDIGVALTNISANLPDPFPQGS